MESVDVALQTTPPEKRRKQARFATEVEDVLNNKDENNLFEEMYIVLAEKGIGPVQLEVLKKRIESMGGCVEREGRLTHYTTHVVATTYSNALSYLGVPRIPDHISVHTLSWLTDSLRAGERPSRTQGRLYPFAAELEVMSFGVTRAQQKAMSRTASLSDRPPVPLCDHAEPCLLKHVSKQDKNFGRPFYCCSMRAKRKRCKFFQWMTDKETWRASSSSPSSSQSSVPSSAFNPTSSAPNALQSSHTSSHVPHRGKRRRSLSRERVSVQLEVPETQTLDDVAVVRDPPRKKIFRKKKEGMLTAAVDDSDSEQEITSSLKRRQSSAHTVLAAAPTPSLSVHPTSSSVLRVPAHNFLDSVFTKGKPDSYSSLEL